MIIQSRFGAAQTGLGYQFYDATGALLSARITAGITVLPETGSYIANATVPSGAVGVYWNSSTSTATEDLRETLMLEDLPAPDNAGIAAIIAQTDLLPSDPADQSVLMAAIAGIGGLSPETIALLDAADQILLGTLYVPDEAPAMIIPAPDSDESLTVVYIYTESITNVKRAGIEITLKLITSPAKSERVLEIAPKTMTTDADGYAQLTVQRDHRYRVTSRDLALNVIIEPTAETYNLLSIIP